MGVRFFVDPNIHGSNVQEGGACRKTTLDFWVETKVLQFVSNNKKGGLS